MFVVDEAGIRIPPASSTSVVAGGGRHENCALFPRPARQPMTATQADPSLQALMLPFADGTLAWPRDGALFLQRWRDGGHVEIATDRDTARRRADDRKSEGEGKRVSVRVDLGGRRIIKKKTTTKKEKR